MAGRSSDPVREVVEFDIEAAASKLSIDEPISCTRQSAVAPVVKAGAPTNEPPARFPSPKFGLVEDYHIRDAPHLGSEYLS
jgi:hypothetical protein